MNLGFCCRVGTGFWLVWLVFGACNAEKIRPGGDIPELPQIALESFVPETRAKLEPAYRAAKSSPQDVEASGKLAMTLHAYDQFALAEACYRRANLLEPRSFRWQYYLGRVLASQRKDAEAGEVFRGAIEIDPHFVPLRLAYANSLFLAGKSVESEAEYAKLIARENDLPQAHFGLGSVLVSRGRTEEAIPHLVRACEIAPDFAQARYSLALAYRDAGLAEESDAQLALYQNNQSGAPSLADPFMTRVRRLRDNAPERVSRGVRLAAAGKEAEAITEHERALEIAPDFAQAHSNLMTLYASDERLEEAQEHYRAAVELNPHQADLHYNFGVLMFEQARYLEAGEAFRKSLEINPNYAESHNNLGQVLERENRLDEAMKHYLLAVASKPNYRLAYFHLGRMQVARGLLEAAVESFQKSLEPADEMTPTFMYAMAAALVRLGRREEALEYGRRGEQLATSHGQHELAVKIRTDLRSIERPRTTP